MTAAAVARHPQAGITNRPPEHGLVIALSLTAADSVGARTAVAALRDLVKAELRSDLADTTPGSNKDAPSAETGELGFDDGYDRYFLTITVGFSAGAYSKLGVPADQRPQDLIDIPWAQLQDSPENSANGDIVLQVCTDSAYLAEHALRRIEYELAAHFSIVWTSAGVQRHNSRSGRVNRREGRALIGFQDGTSNLDPRRSAEDARLVFVDPDNINYPPQVPLIEPGQSSPYGGPQLPAFPSDLRVPPTFEPAWTKNGTYMVVRASTIDTAAWDVRTLRDQEHIVGRWKVSGSALHASDDPSAAVVEPDFGSDPDGVVTPLASHVRKTNPRGPGDGDRRIFRRGYPLIQTTVSGQRRGLLFVCFGRTITTQFEFITRAWTVNPDFPRPGAGQDALRAFERVLCGGYFFVPPLQRAAEPWSWVVPDA
ncbi:Dyp-type peroxidase [Baekduia sp. Peel2402]|uniref:Dyp-type peroxidase n=1 Tax=Baekduia sp. Peel2402 TaxID=3458296 RepID=UPI00403E765D